SDAPESLGGAAWALATTPAEKDRVLPALIGALDHCSPGAVRTLTALILDLDPSSDQCDHVLTVVAPMLPHFAWAPALVRRLVSDQAWVEWLTAGFSRSGG